MAQTLVRLIYDSVTFSLHRTIIPDNDSELPFHTSVTGESILDISNTIYNSFPTDINGIAIQTNIEEYIAANAVVQVIGAG